MLLILKILNYWFMRCVYFFLAGPIYNIITCISHVIYSGWVLFETKWSRFARGIRCIICMYDSA